MLRCFEPWERPVERYLKRYLGREFRHGLLPHSPRTRSRTMSVACLPRPCANPGDPNSPCKTAAPGSTKPLAPNGRTIHRGHKPAACPQCRRERRILLHRSENHQVPGPDLHGSATIIAGSTFICLFDPSGENLETQSSDTSTSVASSARYNSRSFPSACSCSCRFAGA